MNDRLHVHFPNEQRDGIRSGLLSWWPEHARPLPWRDTRDPWAVLVSEVMAQQTQVDRVIPRWLEFLERFPSPDETASAPLSDILRLWSGLGYNSRGKRLHEAARVLVAEHESQLPESLPALLELPGVGPYTARAILAFAFERDVAVLDTNVGRVLARLVGRTLGASEAQTLADALVPTGAGWAWNQALLDFGAIVCRKTEPGCHSCPLCRLCHFGNDQEGVDPASGSFGVSTKQSKFEGSDRQGRGRLMKALVQGPIRHEALADTMGWPAEFERASTVAQDLIHEGLIETTVDGYRLPES